ncbi:Spo0E family sporulation regulatory protein-aspartic acid phosphatase [Lentibacillus salinarum]|uniref:Spo0E family sporulation regulatory protein-aspartic acid phosphatase n=1 Tax=Lentibacillus salinarum TaxID=446820 RepID=A0ABW3ZWL7_9BACI
MTQTLSHLSHIIEQKREQMLSVASKYGMENEKTLECSQELDKLILEYQKKKKT